MLKKAGIVVAAAAVGLLAVSPLAFAGDKGDPGHGHHKSGHGSTEINSNKAEKNSKGLINISNNNVAANACTGDIEFISIIDDVAGALAIFGKATADASEVTVCKQDADAGDSVEQKIAD